MSKKSFIIILVLSVIVTYLTPVVEMLISGLSIFGGEKGLPLKFHKSTFSGLNSYDSTMFALDVVFWFVVIFVIQSLIKKITSK